MTETQSLIIGSADLSTLWRTVQEARAHESCEVCRRNLSKAKCREWKDECHQDPTPREVHKHIYVYVRTLSNTLIVLRVNILQCTTQHTTHHPHTHMSHLLGGAEGGEQSCTHSSHNGRWESSYLLLGQG